MKLIKFNIRNYKSVLESGECEVNEPIIVLAGKNESGKTNILEALFKLYEHESFNIVDKTLGSVKIPEVDAVFELSGEDIDEILMGIKGAYNHIFSKQQTLGFKQSNIINIIKNEDNYEINGDVYSGILKIIDVDVQELIDLVDEIKESFDSDILDILDALYINISEQDGLDEIQTKVNKLVEFFENNIDSSNAKQESIDTYVEDLNNFLNKMLKRPKEDDIKQLFIDKMPHIILFKSFDEEKIKDSMTFQEAEESQFIKDLNKISNVFLDFDEIRKNQENDFWIQNFQEDFSASITKDFMDYWDPESKDIINNVDIKIRIADGKISFFVSNPNTRKQFHPSQRSKGFQWFLSFYTRIVSNTNDGVDNIILIDEPGLFLHAKAQKSVLKVLNNLSKKDQIIYSTHSPYLIEEDKLERIRLIEKDKNDHTQVLNKFYDTKDQDTLTPILTAIGHDVFSGIVFDEKKNSVILEGISDYLILNSMMKHLDYKFDKKIHYIPMKGADSISKYAPFFIGWGLNFLVVVDNDSKGKQVQTTLKDKWLLSDEMFIPISKIEGESIEDLFHHDEYFKYLLEKDSFNSDKLISKQVNNSQKVLAAKNLERKLGEIELSKETKNNFNLLFNGINGFFNGN